MCVRADVISAPSDGFTWMYGMLRFLSCRSTFVYATRALSEPPVSSRVGVNEDSTNQQYA